MLALNPIRSHRFVDIFTLMFCCRGATIGSRLDGEVMENHVDFPWNHPQVYDELMLVDSDDEEVRLSPWAMMEPAKTMISPLATGYPLASENMEVNQSFWGISSATKQLLSWIIAWIVYGGRNALLGHSIARASYIIRMLCCMYGCWDFLVPLLNSIHMYSVCTVYIYIYMYTHIFICT